MEQLFGIALDCISVPNKVQVWYQWCKRFPCEMPTFQLNIQGLQHFRFLLIKKYSTITSAIQWNNKEILSQAALLPNTFTQTQPQTLGQTDGSDPLREASHHAR